MNNLLSAISKITGNWNYEIIYLEGEVEKHSRCLSSNAKEAVKAFFDNTETIPDDFVVTKRQALKEQGK